MNYTISVTRVQNEKFCISLTYNSKRYKYYNGKPIGLLKSPNKLPVSERRAAFEDLKLDYQLALRNGWTPESVKNDKKDSAKITGPATIDDLWEVYEIMKQQNYSVRYLKDLHFYVRHTAALSKGEVTEESFTKFIATKKHWCNTSYNNARRYIGVLEERLRHYGYTGNWKLNNKSRRATQKLHKPFRNVEVVLDDIYKFNPKLHLCCILTYGCLLRPHQEIRQLLWGDFLSLLSQVSLSGSRTKGKRNRVIPIPEYIRPYLTGGPADHNIFTGTTEPHNPDYFKTLWSKYKKQSTLLEKHHTLYSFRHTGAIKVYEKTGSLTVLQQVMGHADLKTSLTYLRGLEIQQLEVIHMPELV
jgi:integrase